MYTLIHYISSSGKGKIHRGRGPVRRDFGYDCPIRRGKKLLHNERRVSRSVVKILGPDVVAPLIWKIVLDDLTSIASELRNRILISTFVPVEQISYARWLQSQTFATFSFVVPVEVRQERSSSSTEIRHFLKRLTHP
jgi:hypothetical protein